MSFGGQRGLFVDMDGTLADSLAVLDEVYHSFLLKYGKTGSASEFAALNGPPLVQIITILKQHHKLKPSEPELLAHYQQEIAQAYNRVQPASGAINIIKRAVADGWKVAVVTSADMTIARVWLARVGLQELVFTIIAGDSVQKGKPAPDPYLLALKRCDCRAADSLAVEDSPGGMQAAVSAGIPTVFINSSRDDKVLPPGVVGQIRVFSELAPFLDAPAS